MTHSTVSFFTHVHFEFLDLFEHVLVFAVEVLQLLEPLGGQLPLLLKVQVHLLNLPQPNIRQVGCYTKMGPSSIQQ